MNQLLKCSVCGSLSMVTAGQMLTCPKCSAPLAGRQGSSPPVGQPKLPVTIPRSALSNGPDGGPSKSSRVQPVSTQTKSATAKPNPSAQSAAAKPTVKSPVTEPLGQPACEPVQPPVPARMDEDLELRLADEPPGMTAMTEFGAWAEAAPNPVIQRRSSIRTRPVEESEGRPLTAKLAVAFAAVLLLGVGGGVGYYLYTSVLSAVDTSARTDYGSLTWEKFESTSGWFQAEGPGPFRTNRQTPLRNLVSESEDTSLVAEECARPSHRCSFLVLYRGVNKTFSLPGEEALLQSAAKLLGGKLTPPRPVRLKCDPPASGLEAEVDGPEGRVLLRAIHVGNDLWYVLAASGAGIDGRQHPAVERFFASFAPAIPSVDVLAVQIADSDAACNIIGQRLQLFGEKAVPTLKNLLRDGRPTVGKRTVEFLNRDEPWIPSVWDAALDSPHPEARGEMLSLLLKRATRGDAVAGGRLAKAVSHAQPDVRATALDMVLRRANFPADVQATALKAALADPDGKVVAQAVDVCVTLQARQPQALPPMASITTVAKRTDLAPAVRAKLVEVLTRAGPGHAAVLETLLAGVRDSVPEYRLASVIGLGRLDPKTAEAKAVPALVAVMDAAAREGKSAEPVGRAAADSLLRLGGSGIEAVQRSLAHKSETIRGFALEALSHPPSGAAVSGADVLNDLSHSADPLIRRAVVSGMGQLLPERPHLAARLSGLLRSDTDEEVRYNAAVSLLQLTKPEVIGDTVQAMSAATEDSAPRVRQAALGWLARHAGPRAPAAEAMVRRLADADPTVRAVAAQVVLAGREDAERVATLEPPLTAGLRQSNLLGRVHTAVVALQFAVVLQRPEPILPDRINALLTASAPIVLEGYEQTQSPAVRDIARRGLGGAVNHLPDAKVSTLMQGLLTSKDPADATALAGVLEGLLSHPMRSQTAMSAVVRAYLTGNLPEATTLKLIARAADPTRSLQARQTTASELSNILASPGAAKDSATRRRALILLGHMHDAAAPFVSQVTGVLKNRTGEAAECRLAAAQCLGHMRSHAVGALPDLLACQNPNTEMDPAVRAAATAAIQQIRAATGMADP